MVRTLQKCFTLVHKKCGWQDMEQECTMTPMEHNRQIIGRKYQLMIYCEPKFQPNKHLKEPAIAGNTFLNIKYDGKVEALEQLLLNLERKSILSN